MQFFSTPISAGLSEKISVRRKYLVILLKGEKMRIKALLLVICLILVGYYHGGCIQSKKEYYDVKLTEKQKAEIAEMAAQKVIEAEKQETSNK